MPDLARLPLPFGRPILLEIDFTEPLVPPPTDPIDKLAMRGRHGLRPTMRALHDAGSDPRVVGLVAKVGGTLNFAAAQEYRAAVQAFRDSGKPAVAWAETFEEGAGDTAAYLLASGFSQIWLQPGGMLGLLGVAAEATFLAGTLERLGIEPQLEQRHEFKNAADMLQQTALTPAHRESLERLTRSLFDQVVAAVAEGRGMTDAEVRTLADTGPRTAAEALAAGLVDRLGYRDEVYAAMRTRVADGSGETRAGGASGGSRRAHAVPAAAGVGGASGDVRPGGATREAGTGEAARDVGSDGASGSAGTVAAFGGAVDDGPRLLFADRWRPLPKPRVPHPRREHVALVEASGLLGSGRSRSFPVAMTGSDTVTASLRAAAEDDRAKAVVLRIDSRGGSVVASQAIWREVCRVRATGKPVVVSMGEVAASGGYFIACPADAIVALPATITGSIGVIGGKIVTDHLLERLGVTTDDVAQGERALMFSSRRRFTDVERERFAATIDTAYDDFVAKVADGRGRSRTEIEAVARGRVWTGSDAAAVGLVDELGGLRDAVRIARSRAGLPQDAPVRAALRPGLVSALRQPRNSEDPRAAFGLGVQSPRALIRSLGLPGGLLYLAPTSVRQR